MRIVLALILALQCCSVRPLLAETQPPQAPGLIEKLRAEKTQSQTQEPHAANRISDFKPDQESPSMFGLFFKIFQALGLCLAVLAFGIFLLKRFAPSAAKSGPRRMRIIERLAISSKTCLLLVEMDGRSVLLSVGSERVSISENELPFKLAAEEEKEFDLICNQEAIKLSA